MIQVVSESNSELFQQTVNAFLKQGYKLLSTNCGFVNSERYEFCDAWHAVLAKPEDTMKDKSLKGVKTYKLVEELAKREGVSEVPVGPEGTYNVMTNTNSDCMRCVSTDQGPARILIVID